MASCKSFEEALWEAAETGNISAGLRQHLDACPACRENLASQQKAMTGLTELRRMPEHVPTVTLAPLLPATRWWPRVAFAGMVMLLAIAAVSIILLTRKQPVPVVKQPKAPVIRPEQPRQPSPIIVKDEKPPVAPRVVRHAVASRRQRHLAKTPRLPKPVPARQEHPIPEPQLLPVPEYDPAEALISAQPVSTLTPLAAMALPAKSLTAVSDLPLAYALIPVPPEEIPWLLNPESTPEDGRAPGERPDVVNASLDGTQDS